MGWDCGFGKCPGVFCSEKHDLVIIAEFPNTEQAIKASVALTKMTEILFTTAPAVTVEDFDKMME